MDAIFIQNLLRKWEEIDLIAENQTVVGKTTFLHCTLCSSFGFVLSVRLLCPWKIPSCYLVRLVRIQISDHINPSYNCFYNWDPMDYSAVHHGHLQGLPIFFTLEVKAVYDFASIFCNYVHRMLSCWKHNGIFLWKYVDLVHLLFLQFIYICDAVLLLYTWFFHIVSKQPNACCYWKRQYS